MNIRSSLIVALLIVVALALTLGAYAAAAPLAQARPGVETVSYTHLTLPTILRV